MGNRERTLWEEIGVAIIRLLKEIITGFIYLLAHIIKGIFSTTEPIIRDSIKVFIEVMRKTYSGQIILYFIGFNFFVLGLCVISVAVSFLNTIPYVEQSVFGKPLVVTLEVVNTIINNLSFSSDGHVKEKLISILSGISVTGILAEFCARKFGLIKLGKDDQ